MYIQVYPVARCGNKDQTLHGTVDLRVPYFYAILMPHSNCVLAIVPDIFQLELIASIFERDNQIVVVPPKQRQGNQMASSAFCLSLPS